MSQIIYSGWGGLSLREQYSFPIFSDDYIFKNMGEAFRPPSQKQNNLLFPGTKIKNTQ